MSMRKIRCTLNGLKGHESQTLDYAGLLAGILAERGATFEVRISGAHVIITTDDKYAEVFGGNRTVQNSHFTFSTDDGDPTEAELTRIRTAAEDLYVRGSDNDIEIDDEPRFSPADGGTWVAMWGWVADEEGEDDGDEDEE